MSAPLGIDLGTTNSVVATITDSRASVLPNSLGEETTASVIYFPDANSAVVGSAAREQAAADPTNAVELIKRAMGTEHPVIIRGQHHTPESLSALILKSLVANLPDRSPEVVITVPAYFGTAEREATYQAGRIAGLRVLDLLDEPVAAAIHYGMTAGGTRSVLVYDLGGGTFDATVLAIDGESATVVATVGHARLGGADVDDRLLEIVLARVAAHMDDEANYDQLIERDDLVGAVRMDVERAKRDLSSREACDLRIVTPDDRIRVRLTRADLEDACADLFDTTAALIEELLALCADKGVTSIDDAIMVGGSSRIPALTARLEALVGVRPRLVEPDLAVAKGAALRAAALVGSVHLGVQAPETRDGCSPVLPSTPKLTNVVPACPRAIGIRVEDSHDPTGERGFVQHVVQPHTSLPVDQAVRGLGTIRPAQDTVRIQVYEQAGSTPSPELDHNRRVLDGELTGLGSLPAGSAIDIRVKLGMDARLTVVAREPLTGRELVLEAYMDGVVDAAETERLARAVGLIEVLA